jgi:hypothetical protein
MVAAPDRIAQGGVLMKKLMTGMLVLFAIGALRTRRPHRGGHHGRHNWPGMRATLV